MFFVSFCVASYFYRRYGLLEFLTSFYVLAHVTYSCFWHWPNFGEYTSRGFLLQREILHGAFATLLIFFVVIEEIIERKFLEILFMGLGLLLCLHFWIFKHFYFPDGHLMTQTLSGVFLGLLLPIAIRRSRILTVLFTVTAICTHGHTAIATVGAFFIGLTIEKRWKLWPLVPVGIGVTTGVIAWMRPYWLTNDQQRFIVWKGALDFIHKNGFQLFGLGAGSAYQAIPWIQIENKMPLPGYMTYLHSEPIQIFFELGLVGITLFTLLYLKGMSRKTAPLLLSILASSVTMFPFRHETFLFLIVFQLHPIYQKRVTRWCTEVCPSLSRLH
jgi:hypothetical protein